MGLTLRAHNLLWSLSNLVVVFVQIVLTQAPRLVDVKKTSYLLYDVIWVFIVIVCIEWCNRACKSTSKLPYNTPYFVFPDGV